MPGFLYFLPGERTFQPTHLAEYGLTHIVDSGVGILQQQVMRGPDGQPGVLIGAADRWTQDGVKWSDRWQFRPFPKPHAAKQAMCCWLGDQQLPGPEELARTKQLVGEALTLADGRQWLIPYARRWEDGQFTIMLPRTIDIDEDGRFVFGDVLLQYQAIWKHASNYWQMQVEAAMAVSAGEPASLIIHNPMELVVDALAANYRVSARELGVLQAIDDQLAFPVASILVDTEGMKQLEKKTENATGDG